MLMNYPLLRGFGNSVVKVLGRCRVLISIDEVEAEVDLFVVPDNAMHVPVMVGQTFTEKNHTWLCTKLAKYYKC